MKGKGKFKGIFTAAAALMCLTALPVSVGYAAVETPEITEESEKTASSQIKVASRTVEAIDKYFAAHPFDDRATVYTSNPSAKSPYALGAVSQDSLDNALNCLNCMRYIAGLQPVALDSSYNELAQAGALIDAAVDDIDHYPKRPSGMSDALYSKCKTGAGSSNLYWNSMTRGMAFSVREYLDDSDAYNIDRLGHRRWCLQPDMGKTGFGQVGTYHAMYVFDSSNSKGTENGVVWPAQNMPIEYFGKNQAWSISLNKELTKSKIKVTLKRRSDSKTWTFSSSSSNGAFYVDNQNYGNVGCIIFRPNDITGYTANDVFDVTIEGADTSKITYTVDFFSLLGDYRLGDIDNDGDVDPIDASSALREYSVLSTNNGVGTFSRNERKAGDVNSSGNLDTTDASWILEYYSYLSTAKNPMTDMREWIAKYHS